MNPLPSQGFRYFKPGRRTVDDGGLVQVEGSYYAALPAAPHSEVLVRIYANDIEILSLDGTLLRRHEKSQRKGEFKIEPEDRVFNPSRETGRLLVKAQRIGPNAARFAQELFTRLGRPGNRAIYGLSNLPRTHTCAQIEEVCARLLDADLLSYGALKRALERRATQSARASPAAPAVTEATIKAIDDDQDFWDKHSQTNPTKDASGNVCH